MKILPLLAATSLFLHCSAVAQECSFKYGNVTREELQMTSYAPDPDAEAVFLYDDFYLNYDVGNKLVLELYRTVRIKVLKSEGVKWGDIEFYYYLDNNAQERISQLEGTSYNLVNGKVVRTPLKKQLIFEEEVDKNTRRVKFSLPEVREGSVFEYRYLVRSEFIGSIPTLYVQHEIPVMHSNVDVTIPWCFTFQAEICGDIQLDVERMLAYGSSTGSSKFRYKATRYVCKTENVPALKEEPYVWCTDDHRSGLRFEINDLEYPGYLNKHFTTTWAEVNDLLEHTNFGRFFKTQNPFTSEVAEIVARTDDRKQQLHEILKLVQSRVTWDGYYRLSPQRSPAKAAEEGRGDSGSINCILAAALRDAGFTPKALLLNPRSYGRLPETFATDNIRTFVVMVTLGGESFYLDGTDPHTDVGTLPAELLVDRARIYGIDNPSSGWIDLTRQARSMSQTTIDARLSPEGELICTLQETSTKQAAYDTSLAYAQSESHEQFIQSREQAADITISELSIEGVDTPETRLTQTFRKMPATAGERIYLHPTVIPFLTENPFTARQRSMPVEFSYPKRIQITVNISLPEGYDVEEFPKPMRMTACRGGLIGALMLDFQEQERIIRCRFEFDRSRVRYTPDEYDALSSFYGFLADLCNSQIVIRKGSESTAPAPTGDKAE